MLRGCIALLMLCMSGLAPAAERPTGPVEDAQCVSCHTELQPSLVQGWRASGHGVAKAGCVSCHGAVHDGGLRARQGAACVDCHGGAKSPTVHSYASSKHGIIAKLEGADWDWTQPLRAANYRTPNCAYCHMYAGEHDTRRLLANDSDPAATTRARDAAKAVCYDCHAPRYIGRQDETSVRMLEIARMKWREGDALVQSARSTYSDVELAEALRLLARMQAHVTNVRLGVAHQSPDYQWWHGQPALDGDLLRIKGELSRLGRSGPNTISGAGMNAAPPPSQSSD
jgi:hypothetical protein